MAEFKDEVIARNIKSRRKARDEVLLSTLLQWESCNSTAQPD